MLRILQQLLTQVNPVHLEVQKRSTSMSRLQSLVGNLMLIMSGYNCQSRGEDFFSECITGSRSIGIDFPSLPRRTRSQNANRNESVRDYYVSLYVSVYSETCSAIASRFASQSLEIVSDIENSLLRGSAKSLDEVKKLYHGDMCANRLASELEQLRVGLLAAAKSKDVTTIDEMHCLFASDSSYCIMFPSVSALLSIYPSLPCTSCEAERSFSALRRLKTYLRSTTSQKRLNHICLLNILKEHVDSLELPAIVNRWIDRNALRQNSFARR